MRSLAEIVVSPGVSSELGWVIRPRKDIGVERVALVEDLANVVRLAPNSIAVLTAAAAAAASTYRLDMALRAGRSRAVAALVIPAAQAGRITPTAAAVADRSGTAILATSDEIDLAELAAALSREIAGESDVALLRAHAALRAIDAHPLGGSQDALLVHAGAALGVSISFVPDEPPDGSRAPLTLDGHVEGWLTAPEQSGDLALALEIVLRLAADRARTDLANARRAEELPMASQVEVLTELLAAPPHGRAALVQRARDLDVPIDGWHVAARVEFQELSDTSPGDEQSIWEARLGAAQTALRSARGGGGNWHGARAGTAFVLVRMFREDPGVGAGAGVAHDVDGVLHEMRARLPGTLVRCGVGSAHSGPGGLGSSIAEAKAAVATSRAAGSAGGAAVPFDSVGLRRSLVQWYASDVAKEAVTTVLAPLTNLGGARAERLLQTLHVYLDQRGSLTKTAERLSLHRNAVAYRIDQAFSLLDVDPDNPDDLLLLQLACRARDLT